MGMSNDLAKARRKLRELSSNACRQGAITRTISGLPNDARDAIEALQAKRAEYVRADRELVAELEEVLALGYAALARASVQSGQMDEEEEGEGEEATAG